MRNRGLAPRLAAPSRFVSRRAAPASPPRVHHAPVKIRLQRDELRALHGREERGQVSLLTRKQLGSLPLQANHLVQQCGRRRLVRGITCRNLMTKRPTDLHLTGHQPSTLRLVSAIDLLELRRLLGGEPQALAHELSESRLELALQHGPLFDRPATRAVADLRRTRHGGRHAEKRGDQSRFPHWEPSAPFAPRGSGSGSAEGIASSVSTPETSISS